MFGQLFSRMLNDRVGPGAFFGDLILSWFSQV
ncbi:MAG: hypothetical protein ACI9HK_001240, partial [Pirellulaceae bacterium]